MAVSGNLRLPFFMLRHSREEASLSSIKPDYGPD